MNPLNVSNYISIEDSNIIHFEKVKTVFSVLIVSTVLTIYEILMLYIFMIPEVKKQIDSGIIQLSLFCKNIINKNINEQVGQFPPEYMSIIYYNIKNESIKYIDETKYNFLSIFKTYEQRENLLINKINTYNLFTSCLLLFILFFSVFLIIYYLKKNNQKILDKYIWISIITVIFILVFQYMFFLYASNYSYLGSQDEFEIVYFIMSIL